MPARLLACFLALFPLGAAAQDSCGARLFVSGFFSTVHVYDACTGSYLRDLDLRSRLFGAMAVRLGPDGFIYVVAEEGGKVHKYRNDTLEYAGVHADVGLIGATGLAFDPFGVGYVAGYQTSDVRRITRAGAANGTAVPANAAGLRGPDNGMTFGPDGNLYIPGYDSHNVVRWDPRTGQASVAVAARTANLTNTRGLLPAKGGQEMFITSEGSGRLLRWNLASGAVSLVTAGLARPTGIDYGVDGKLLVSSGDSVVRIDPDTGQNLGVFVPEGLGGLSAQVFLAVIPKGGTGPAGVDSAQIGTQFWVSGDIVMHGRVVEMDVLSATGTAFGPTLAFGELTLKRWGHIRMEVVSCTQARFSWSSTGANSAGFGSGEWDVFRFFQNEATQRCIEKGIDDPDRTWMDGMWWGGDARSGEGLSIDRRSLDGRTFFAWFTHRPPPGLAGVDTTQTGTQYWIAATGKLAGRVLPMDEAFSATGAKFGAALRPADIVTKRWGSIRIELVSCTEARFTYDSTGPASAGFGSATYSAFKFFENEDTARCVARGVDDPDRSWMNGMWWFGQSRAGEGFVLDRATDGTTFLAWFTHRPR